MRLFPLAALVAALSLHAQTYTLGPDSQPKAGVPHGTVTKYILPPGKFYPGTPHDYSVYVPAQYDAAKPTPFMIFATLTFLLGSVFLIIEAREFAGMVEKGAGPWRSGFLSAFFTLVGTHGAHVTAGLIALVYLMAQVIAKGLQAAVLRRLLCWSLFWHALDIVWVGVFTLVYLMGVPH